MAENTTLKTIQNSPNAIKSNLIDFILFAFVMITASMLLYVGLTSYLFNNQAQERAGQLGGGHNVAYESSSR